MKKAIIVILSVLMFGVAVSAQPRALGIRGGYGAELSYQHSLGSNFLEADLGMWGGNAFYLTGIYDFVFAQSGIVNFYVGPGAQVGFYNTTNDQGKATTAMALGVVGQLGAEFEIPAVPINISIDWKPVFNFIGGGFGWNGFALGLRYRF